MFISRHNTKHAFFSSSDPIPALAPKSTHTEKNATSQPRSKISRFLGGNVGGLGGLGPPRLGLAAVGVGAHGTAHEQLRAAARPLAQVRLDDVGQPGDEERVVVGCGAAGDALGADLLADVLGVLDVQLVEGLDVLVDEGDGDEHEVLVAALHQGCVGEE